MAETQGYNFWVNVVPAEDLPGKWVAHCLELDVVTWGDSPSHALAMAQEAVGITVCADLAEGRDPLARRAPRDAWDLRDQILSQGQVLDVPSERALDDARKLVALTALMPMVFVRVDPDDSLDRKLPDEIANHPLWGLPQAWLKNVTGSHAAVR